MIRQYNPQRHRRELLGGIMRPVGTIPVGAILDIRGTKIRVEAWIPRDYSVYERGRFTTKRIAGGHMALVRNLRTGQQFELSDVWLRDAPEVDYPARTNRGRCQ